jgi:hypothetical protein
MIVYLALLTITLISLFYLRKEMGYNYSLVFNVALVLSTFASSIFILIIKIIILKKDEDFYLQLSVDSNSSGKSEKNELSLIDENTIKIKINDNIQFNKTDGIFDKIKYENGKIVLNDINKPIDGKKNNFDFSKDKQADFNSKLYF